MKPIIFTASGSSNVAEMLSLGLTSQNHWELDEIKFHLSTVATASNNLVVQQRSKYGSAYDTVILVHPMNTVSDVLWQPERPIKMNGKDRLSVAWTNDAASFKTWGLQINYKA